MRIIIASDLSEWERGGVSLAITGRRDPLPNDVSLLLTPDNVGKFNALVECCGELGIVDMYGASTDLPMVFLRRSMEILSNSGVSLPSRDALTKYKIGIDAWGEPIPDLEFAKILDAYGVKLEWANGLQSAALWGLQRRTGSSLSFCRKANGRA